MKRTPIHLLVTAPVGSISSMTRYADLVERALREHAPSFEVVRHSLAPTPDSLRRWPGFLRNRLHHTQVARAARRLARSGAKGIWHVLDGSHAYVTRGFPPAATVVTCHDLIPVRMGTGEFGRRPRLPARLLIERSRAGLAAAAAVVAVSRLSGQEAVTLGRVDPARLSVVPNPVDEAWLAAVPLPRAPRPLPDAYVFHLGHDAAYKNRQGAWNVFRRLAPRWPGKLVIAGSPCSPALAADIAAANLSHRVEFITFPDESRLRDLYRGASLFLFPSRFEGFGWPPLEAFACGCPAIASDVGGLRDVLGGDPPCLFDPFDEDGMATAALNLLENPARADAWVAAGRARVSACTSKVFAAGLSGVYATLAKGRGDS